MVSRFAFKAGEEVPSIDMATIRGLDWFSFETINI